MEAFKVESSLDMSNDRRLHHCFGEAFVRALDAPPIPEVKDKNGTMKDESRELNDHDHSEALDLMHHRAIAMMGIYCFRASANLRSL
jgi:hypothetical protein